MAVTANKHILLVEIDWDTGTEGYGMERYRTPALDYQDYLIDVSAIRRVISPFGLLNFPAAAIRFSNTDLYFTKKWNNTPHRNKTLRVKIIPPNSGIGDAITVFSGTISRMRITGSTCTVETSGNNFEELFTSDMSAVIPVLNKGLFPALPEGQIPTSVPLLYGRLHNSAGESLEDQTITPAATRGFLIDENSIATENWSGFNAAANRVWVGVAWSPSLALFAAVSSNGGTTEAVMTSPDGETWTLRTTPTSQTWSAICWSEVLDLFVAVSNNTSSGSGVMTSPDGINWTDRTAASTRDWRGIVAIPDGTGLYASGIALVAVAGSGDSSRVMTSLDGVTWTSRTAASTNNWNSVVFAEFEDGSELLVAVASSGTGNRVMTSVTATTWTSRTTPADNSWTGIAWSPQLQLFVVVGQSGTGDRVMISEDALEWFLVPSPEDKNWSRVAWAPSLNLFAAIGTGASATEIMTSPDGFEWTTRTNPSVAWFGLTWAEELYIFVAVGSASTNGTMHSPDDLKDKFKYVLGTGALSGDNGDEGNASFVFNYATRVPLPKALTQETFGDFTVTVVGFAVDQRDVARPTEQEITAYLSGIRTGGAGTGPYLNPAEIKEHFLLNYAKVAAAQIDATAQTAAEAACEVMHTADDDSGAVTPAACGILLQNLHESFSSILQKMDLSFGMMTAQILNGKLATIVLTLGAEPAATVDFTDEKDILKDSLIIDDPQEVATVLQINMAERGTSGRSGDPIAGQLTGQQVASGSFGYELPRARAEMFGASSTKVIERDLNIPYCRRVGAAINVARAVSEFLRPGGQSVQFEVPISYFDDVDVGDFITVTHWLGTSTSGGWTQIKMQVLEVSAILTPASLRLQIIAFRRAPGIAVHDNFDRAVSNTLGSSWSESAGAAGTLQIADASSADGATFNQSQSLLAANDGLAGVAIWDVTTDNDQVASIQVIEFAALAEVGVAVRAAGAYTSFTGYVALIEATVSGDFVRLYRCSSTDLSASSGTQLAEKELPVAPTPGDIVEIRAAGTRVEVWYFSDVPVNNFGKVIGVTDANISSGKLAVVSVDGGGTYLTNFYGRSFT